MKPFKKILGIVALSTALVAGLGVVASAKTSPTLDDIKAYDDDFKDGWYPEVTNKMTVFLYKDSAAKDNALHWKLDPATSVIPIKHMSWEADFRNIKTDTQQVTVKRNKTGQYYLNIECSKYIKPGKEVDVSWAIKQHGYWFNMKTTLKFAKAALPYSELIIDGEDLLQNQKAWNHLRGVRTLNFKEIRDPSGDPYPVVVRIREAESGYKLVKIVVTKKDGHSYTIRNYDRVNVDKIKMIQIKYKATKKLRTNSSTKGEFNKQVYAFCYPKESNGYAHLFDQTYVQTIKF
jgi:hypothetical protein